MHNLLYKIITSLSIFERGHFCGYQHYYLVWGIKSVESISMRTQHLCLLIKRNSKKCLISVTGKILER
jgi:hypothetical protein